MARAKKPKGSERAAYDAFIRGMKRRAEKTSRPLAPKVWEAAIKLTIPKARKMVRALFSRHRNIIDSHVKQLVKRAKTAKRNLLNAFDKLAESEDPKWWQEIRAAKGVLVEAYCLAMALREYNQKEYNRYLDKYRLSGKDVLEWRELILR